MPQAKKSKKGKKREESVSEEEKAAMYSMPDRKGQKAKSEGVSDTHTIPATCMCTCIYMYQLGVVCTHVQLALALSHVPYLTQERV